MATWPASLPQYPQVRGYKEKRSTQTVRTQMEKGPAKMRRRHTAHVETIPYRLTLTSTQLNTLETFFDTTLGGGADSFTSIHPRTEASETMRFISPYEIAAKVGDDLYDVIFVLEVLP